MQNMQIPMQPSLQIPMQPSLQIPMQQPTQMPQLQPLGSMKNFTELNMDSLAQALTFNQALMDQAHLFNALTGDMNNMNNMNNSAVWPFSMDGTAADGMAKYDANAHELANLTGSSTVA